MVEPMVPFELKRHGNFGELGSAPCCLHSTELLWLDFGASGTWTLFLPCTLIGHSLRLKVG